MIQWTLAVELRASFLVYLALTVTAEFTRYYRNLVLFFILAFCIYGGDLMGEIPFFTGALFADMSLHLNQNEQNSVSTSHSFVRRNWPIILAVFALFLASYPTNNAHLAGWSQVMTHIGMHLFHPHCSPSPKAVNNRGTEMGVGDSGRYLPNIRHPLFSWTTEAVFE
jgi:hypothetical protein